MTYQAIALVHAKPDNLRENLKKIPGVKEVTEALGQADVFVAELVAETLPELLETKEEIKGLTSVQDCIFELRL